MRHISLLLLFHFFLLSVSWGMLPSGDRVDPRYKERQYRRLVLPNQLKVFLVSDPTMHYASAALSVAVGSLSDPKEHPGLAHFLEHMLFLGTKKYPEAGSYHKFIESNEGYSNAYTSTDHTNYHFQIGSEHLEEALDRFSQFFVAPLFNPEFVEREMQAVASEHSKNIPSDYWRIRQVERHLYDPSHPARHFSTGNLETLKNVTREKLLAFYDQYYSSNQMTLVVTGKEDLDTLEKWVRPRFSKVRNTDKPTLTFPETFLKESGQFRLLQIEPIKDRRTLKITFPLPPTQQDYDSKVDDILGFLIGHEGQGSLLSTLKKEHLATGLSAGTSMSTNSFSAFSVTVQLTPQGFRNYQKIIIHLFQYLFLLKNQGLPSYIYEEIRRMAEVDYRFAEKVEGADLASSFAALMHHIPLEQLETAPFLYQRYDEEQFKKLLNRMIPENMWVTLVAQGVETEQVEPYYEAKYSYQEGGKPFIESLKGVQLFNQLHLPEPNSFIPKELKVLPVSVPFEVKYQSIVGLQSEQFPEAFVDTLARYQDQPWESWEELELGIWGGKDIFSETIKELFFKHAVATPKIVFDDERAKVWFQQNLRLRMPKAALIFQIHTPQTYTSPKHAVLSQLYVDAIEEGLNEFRYAVGLAGLYFGLASNKKGIVLNVEGYSDRIIEFLSTIASKLQTISIDEATFEVLKEKRAREYRNFELSTPYRQAFYARRLILEEKKYSLDQYQEVITEISLEDVKAYAAKLYQQTYLEGMAHGNLTIADAQEGTQHLLRELGAKPLPKKQRFVERVIQLPKSSESLYLKPLKLDNSVLVYDIQAGQSEPKLRGQLLILSRALGTRFYTEMRTKQQLGYIVDGGLTELEETMSFLFLIQSGQYAAGELTQRVRLFILSFLKDVRTLSTKEFEELREAVISAKLKKPETISEEAGRLFYIAFEKDAKFDHVSGDIRAVEQLKQSQVNETAKRVFGAKTRRALGVQLLGSSHENPKDAAKAKLKDIAKFKKGKKVK